MSGKESALRKQKNVKQPSLKPLLLGLGNIAFIVFLAWFVSQIPYCHSAKEGCTHFVFRLFFFFTFLSAFQPFCSALLLIPANALARHIPGVEDDKPDHQVLTNPDSVFHESSIEWPRAVSLRKLPPDWIVRDKPGVIIYAVTP